MDLNNLNPGKLIKMITSQDTELSKLGKEITENSFGLFSSDAEMISYLEHIDWFKDVTDGLSKSKATNKITELTLSNNKEQKLATITLSSKQKRKKRKNEYKKRFHIQQGKSIKDIYNAS